MARNYDREVIDTSKGVEIYPEDFFSIPTPTSPWFSVQFRVKELTSGINIENSDVWMDINEIRTDSGELIPSQNNFVKSIDVEDTGGSKKLTLVLFDKYFSYIENMVMGSMFITRISNEVLKKQANSVTGIPVTAGDLAMNFVVSGENLVNLRVRFGYGDEVNSDKYFDSEGQGSFEKRLQYKSTTIRSPWIYFMINGINNEITDDGLQMTISGISLTYNLLNRIKIQQQFSKLIGTPKELIERFANALKSVNGAKLSIAPFGNGSEEPAKPANSNVDAPIELFLGGEPKKDKEGNPIVWYKSFSEILNDICSKTPPKSAEGDVDKATLQTEEAEGQSSEHLLNYSYYVSQEADSSEKIIFYYPDPTKRQQKYLRVYNWREHGKTIVKSANIQTATDFAIMSQKILINDTQGKEKSELNLLPLGTREDSIDNVEISSNLSVNKILGINKNAVSNGGTFAFTGDIIDKRTTNNEDTSDTYVQQIKNQFLKNINRQVFKGTLEIPGDPTYLFDTQLRPYEYLIKLIIMRPSISGGEVAKSYLSGKYAVSSIKHSINESGYSTSLSIMRWPEKVEDKKIDESLVKKNLSSGNLRVFN
jgi:hypothetical protein